MEERPFGQHTLLVEHPDTSVNVLLRPRKVRQDIFSAKGHDVKRTMVKREGKSVEGREAIKLSQPDLGSC